MTRVVGAAADDARVLLEQLRKSIGLAEEVCRALAVIGDAADGTDGVSALARDEADADVAAVADPAAGDGLIHVYWIGCRGLRDAAQALGPGVRIARIGTSTERDLAVRMNTAAADAYGSWTRDAAGQLVQQPGFTAWMMQAIATTRASIDPAITVKVRSLAVRLPAGMSRRSFDRALHLALDGHSLARAHPDAMRFTLYSVGADRMSRALELYTGLDPRRDGDRLLALVEGILARHRGTAGRMSTIAPSPSRPLPPEVTTKIVPPHRRMSAAQRQAMRARLRDGRGRPRPAA